MKKLLWLLCLLIVAACSEGETEEPYTVEDAREDGHVIVEHQSEQFDQIKNGALGVENIKEMTAFIKNVEQGAEDDLDVSIFNPDGSHYQNSFSYDGEAIRFVNNYGAYPSSPAGTFSCEYMTRRGPMVYVSNCQSEQGKDFSTLLSFVATEKAFRETGN
ncbi:hypothetical protein DXT76_01650 [Halobacillus trueperi]|uniref:DUF4362 domain-containing protein n=2 Tax=Halobacillus TaxID=45667 RepID=A0A1H0Q466_HALAD|nr:MULTISPECIES: hypothetical protein [Halobacillus]RDY72525.1 hypothetical protein DXT76_01650 [Halobacillus trueperi]SDP11429.1 hypothetical protein SAMN05421677_11229 [Halobacillus aidingensis]